MKKSMIVLLALFSAARVSVADFPLMENSKPACGIIIQEDAGLATKRAAGELALYLGKIAGGEKPSIGTVPVKGMYPVYFELVKDEKIGREGFALRADKKALRIQARGEIGFLYGAYEILKTYGGIRWLVPGDDGEYFIRKATIEIPAQASYHNPTFRFRKLTSCGAFWNSRNPDWLDWMVRNNMRVYASISLFKGHGLSHGANQVPDLYTSRAAAIHGGGACFNRMLFGCQEGSPGYKAEAEKLFKEHPEYFPVISGKRTFTSGAFGPQPCGTNPESQKIMANHLADAIREIQQLTPDFTFEFANNDTTSWCECEKCNATDDPVEKAERIISTRAWTFQNAIFNETFKSISVPEGQIWGFAYQNFHPAPRGVRPDARVHVKVAFNDLCWRHKLSDTNCPTNRKFYRYFEDWGKVAKSISTWEETTAVGAAQYVPMEEIYIDNIRTYHKLGVTGIEASLFPLNAECGPVRKSRMEHLGWMGMWQALYIAAQMQWDINIDTDKMYEEINSLYYDKAWNAGMKDYRKLLIRAYTSTPGCFGYLHDNPMGRMLTQPGVEQQLLAYLDKAEAAVKNDPRSLKHVQMDRELFAYHWQKAHENYVKNYRELRAYAKTGQIKIDGVIDESDWQNADIMSNYKIGEKAAAEHQTYVRVIYEPENIYVAIEAMEPDVGKMKASAKSGEDKVWQDNSVEFLVKYPDMGDAYYQFIINHEGIFNELKFVPETGLVAHGSDAEIKTKIYKDRWTAEMRLPTNKIGLQCFSGQAWRFNSKRYRVVGGGANEGSSLSGASGSGSDSFLPLVFAGARNAKNDITWKNGGLDEVYKNEKPPAGLILKDGLMPANWIYNGGGKGDIKLSMELYPGSTNNYYMVLENCRIYNHTKGEQSKYKMSFQAAGHGTLQTYVNRYTRIPRLDGGRGDQVDEGLGADGRKQFVIDSDEWGNFSFEYSKKNPNEIICFVFSGSKGVIKLDNVFLTPMDEGSK